MGQTRHELHAAHLARLARMAAKARPDPGLQLRNGKPIPSPIEPPPPSLPILNGPVQAHYAPAWDFPFTINGDNYRPALTVDLIVRTVCRYYGIGRRDLMRPRRDSGTLIRRHVAIYLATQYTNCSLPYIGRRFDNDHTTIMNARDRITAFLKTDTRLAIELAHLKRMLGVP